jgi:hypothetical protein
MFLRLIYTILLLCSFAVNGQTRSVPKAESEKLMQEAIPFAENLLRKHGEFFPYGNALDPSGVVVHVAGYDGRERPPSADVMNLLKKGFVQGAKEGKFKATAMVYDVRVTLPSSGLKSDAIAVALDHRDNYSVVVFFVYEIKNGSLAMGEVFAREGLFEIFPRR